MTNSQKVNAAIGTNAVFGTNDEGLDYVDVRGEAATGQVYLHGAHATSWVPRGADDSLLWLSSQVVFVETKAIRGGVPICFPWFGPNKPPAGGPSHGLARLTTWQFDETQDEADGAVTARFSITEQTPTPAPGWNDAFRLRDDESGDVAFKAVYSVTFGDTLTSSLAVENTGTRSIGYEAALHTYYSLGDVTTATITGLEGQPFTERAANKAPNGVETTPIHIDGEIDRTYASAPNTVTIHDPDGRRTFTLTSRGTAGWVVWNPAPAGAKGLADFGDDEWRNMLCVEPIALGESMVWLAPGESRILGVKTVVAKA